MNASAVNCLPYLMLRKKAIEPLDECFSEWKLFTELARKLGMGDKFHWTSEEEFVAFELGPTGMTFDRLLQENPEGGFYQQKKYGLGRRVSRPLQGRLRYSARHWKKWDSIPSPPIWNRTGAP